MIKKRSPLLVLLPFIFLALGLGLFVWKGKAPSKPLEPINVQLKWLHQAQFAGLYVAKEKGFFADEGLDATLTPLATGHVPIDEVLSGRAQFGVTGASELLTARAMGKPIQAIAVIYKTSPFALYSLQSSGIAKPQDILGKRLSVEQGTDGPLLYTAVMKALGLDKNAVTEVDNTTYDAADLMNGKADVAMGYVINEPHMAILAGKPVNLMLMSQYGADVYGDVLFTTDAMIQDNPDLVRRFVNAAIQGWTYAVDHLNETVELTLKYATSSTFGHQLFMLQQSVPLVRTGDDPIGWMVTRKWERLQEILLDQDTISAPVDLTRTYTTQFL